MKIVLVDNFARETVADQLVLSGVPEKERDKAEDFCDWVNTFTCHGNGGMFCTIQPDDYRLSRGMEDLV